MSHASIKPDIEDIIDELIRLYLAQAADLREYSQAVLAGEGTVHLERTLRYREVRRAALYSRFEETAFPAPPAPDIADHARTGERENVGD